MTYSVDFGKLVIEEYRELLRNQNLLPGRKALHQNLDAYFFSITKVGIKNLKELTKAISTSPKLKSFSEKTGISEDYLVLLRREIGALEPKSVYLTDFPGMDSKITDALLRAGIKASKDYYELYTAPCDCGRVSKTLAISEDMALTLFCLCSLVRINGIGAAAARCFYEAGFRSVSDIVDASAEDMLVKVSRVNSENHYYKAKLGTKDMQFCIDSAKILSRLS